MSVAPAASEPSMVGAPRRGQAGPLTFASLRPQPDGNSGAVRVGDALLASSLFRKERLHG